MCINGLNVVAVIVTYNPECRALEASINTLLDQVDKVVIVDNCSICDLSFLVMYSSVELIKLEDNFGLAFAQNLGIIKALEIKSNYVLLLDQDSTPSFNMVDSLLLGFQFPNVAAVGPSYIDVRSKTKSFFVTENLGFPSRWKPSNSKNVKFVDAAFLISSGSLIKLDVIKKIGGKRTNYFIDHLDTEWTFRAREAGYRLIGMPEALINHTLGDSVRDIWFFGKRKVSYHSPLRDYYMFRNSLLMFRDLKLSFIWKCYFLWRLLQFSCYFLVFSNDRLGRCKKMALGILHGIMDIRGKLNIETSQSNLLTVTNIDP